jgi:hypothetical protein
MNDTEERVRHLFAVATEDIPPGIDLLRAVREEQSRSRGRARTTRVRVALSAGTAAGLALAAAAAITLSAVPAPSALAQVTKAAQATAGQSYQIRSVSKIVDQDGSAADTPVTVTGEFDPARGVGEQVSSGGSRVLFAGGYMYLSMSGAFKDALERAGRVSVPAGKSWVRFPAPLRPGGPLSVIDLTQIGFATPDVGQLNPQDLLGLLEAASQVSKTGPASGDGWTGSAYAFTATKKFGGSGPLHLELRISGTVDVDQQGRVRQLDSDYSIGKTERKVHMTFGDFGLPVSVSAPPASEVFVPRADGGTTGVGSHPTLRPSWASPSPASPAGSG